MKKIILLVLMITILMVSTTSAFNIKLNNNTNTVLIYNVVWLDCDWEGYPQVVNMAMGELQPGITSDLLTDFVPGPYLIKWYLARSGFDKRYLIKIDQKNGLLITTPNEEPVFLPGA